MSNGGWFVGGFRFVLNHSRLHHLVCGGVFVCVRVCGLYSVFCISRASIEKEIGKREIEECQCKRCVFMDSEFCCVVCCLIVDAMECVMFCKHYIYIYPFTVYDAIMSRYFSCGLGFWWDEA